MIREWYEARATQKTLNRIAMALERIADAVELGGKSSGNSLRSNYRGSGPDDSSLLYQSDDELAALEALERKYPDVPMDEDLDEIGNGQEG